MSDTNEELFEKWFENAGADELFEALTAKEQAKLIDEYTDSDEFTEAVIAWANDWDKFPQDLTAYNPEAFGGE